MKGLIVFDRDDVVLGAVSIHVSVEDTTHADAPATVVSRTTLRCPSYDGATQVGIPFSAPSPTPVAGRRYTVRVHIDVDGDGRAGPGDYVNCESVSVSGVDAGREIHVRMVRVT